jgi:hypothetical protein
MLSKLWEKTRFERREKFEIGLFLEFHGSCRV